MAKSDEDRGFTVVDRRASASSEPAPAATAPPEPGAELPRVDFTTFVLSLGTSALYELGVAPDPAAGGRKPSPNLAVARQTIDALEMLRAKTRGNLDAEETRLLEALLYELHMRFVEASRGPGAPGSPPAPGDPAA
jgi:hypothetical protein